MLALAAKIYINLLSYGLNKPNYCGQGVSVYIVTGLTQMAYSTILDIPRKNTCMCRFTSKLYAYKVCAKETLKKCNFHPTSLLCT